MRDLQAIVATLLAPEFQSAALATLVTVDGSSYRRPGARLLVLPHGKRVGSISGGCLEEDVMARAARVLTTRRAEAVVYDTTSENDLVWGVGLGCHGVVRVLIEPLQTCPAWGKALGDNFVKRRTTALSVRHNGGEPENWGTQLAAPGDCADPEALFLDMVAPPPAFFIFGAGDDAQPLARLAHELGWHVTVCDPRAAFATPERFPTVKGLCVAAADELVAKARPGTDAIAVVMTHHYVHDVPILRELLSRPLVYLGLLGPRKRAEKILGDIGSAPPLGEHHRRLHAPVGLDIGADSPEQVALSIVAEIQATLTQRDGRPLRERQRPIHA